MRLIGDIHGDIFKYMNIISGATESVQVGDFGIGFIDDDLPDQLHADGQHKFIRGNHDDPSRCKERPGYIPDGTYDAERSILYIGGAWSIDWKWRVPGRSWWPDEELSVSELVRMHELMVHHEPRIVVTHDCPASVAYDFFIKGTNKPLYETRTAQALEGMFRRYQPEQWYFGHWHEDVSREINGTQFTCLGINSYVDIEV